MLEQWRAQSLPPAPRSLYVAHSIRISLPQLAHNPSWIQAINPCARRLAIIDEFRDQLACRAAVLDPPARVPRREQ